MWRKVRKRFEVEHGKVQNKNKRRVKCEGMSNNIGYVENVESLRLRQVDRHSDDDKVDECLPRCVEEL